MACVTELQAAAITREVGVNQTKEFSDEGQTCLHAMAAKLSGKKG